MPIFGCNPLIVEGEIYLSKDHSIKNTLYARSMDYAMVCQLRPYPSVVCFETIEEMKVVSSHAMFLWKNKT